MTESGAPSSLTGTLIGRFAVGERLGAGGMGEVYRAEDTRLNRSVAIKRLTDSLRSDPVQRQRFVKEAERVSRLTDPNIAALYDILEENDEIFLVMELVDGCNIRDYFQNERGLKNFVAAAIDAVKGLRTAHSQQIVHCDIKPENIMISSSGQVKILDFGLSKRLSASGTRVSFSTDTSAGMSGTPGYMAPELMLEGNTGPQSDIFSLGVVFYEILAGSHPFTKRTVFETADAILHSEAPKLESLGVSPALSQIIAKMMHKEPSRRYKTCDELLADLEPVAQAIRSDVDIPRPVERPSKLASVTKYLKRHRIAAIAIAILLAAAALSQPAWRSARKVSRIIGLSKAPQVVVLPFKNIGGQAADQAFADGLGDVITSQLTQLTDRYALQVVSANEVRTAGVSSANAARQQFGADLVVEGTLQPMANMWRASYSVVDARNGHQVIAGTISVPTGDPFGLQDQLANRIVAALGLDVPAGRTRTSTNDTTVSAAYDNYLQGLGYMHDYHHVENLDLAISAFNQALQYDSGYSLAYAGLGEAHWHKYIEQKIPSEISDASLACQRALAINSDLPEGYRCLGEVYVSSGKHQEAAQQLEIALAKRPTDDDSVIALADAYEQLKMFSKAEATYQRAIDLRPNYWAGYNHLGYFYFKRGQYTKALAMFEKTKTAAPNNYRGYNNAGAIYISQGNFAKAITEFEKSAQLRPGYAVYSNLGTAYFFQRRYREAAAAYKHALEINDQDYVAWGNLGDAQSFIPGQHSAAAESYQKAIALCAQKLKADSKDAYALSTMATYHAMLGHRNEAERYLQMAESLKPGGPDIWQQASVVYSQFRQKDQTLSAIQSALAAGLASAYVTSSPYFDDLHSDPRFQQLIKSAEKLEKH